MNRSTVSAIEPNILHSPAVIGAVRHHGQSLDCRMPARPCTVVVDDRSNGIVGEDAFDPEDDALASLRVGLHRLFLDQPVHFGVAKTGVIAQRSTRIILDVLRTGIIDGAAG